MTNYSEWDSKTSQLVSALESEEKEDEERVKQELGLQDGKYPRSEAEASELKKAAEVLKMKDTLDAYKEKEEGVHQILSNVWKDHQTSPSPSPSSSPEDDVPTRTITRTDIHAGKRVLTLSDSTGPGHIILSRDLTDLRNALPANATLTPKTYPNDAENSVTEHTAHSTASDKVVHGLIKVNLTELHGGLTVSIGCKVVTGTLDISHCSDLIVEIEGEAAIVTVQVDLCRNVTLRFRESADASSSSSSRYWGEDKDDRVFHAGVHNLNVQLYRDGCLYQQTRADFQEDGAKPIGNASAEEVQFVTSVVNGELIKERVLAQGASTNTTVTGGVQGPQANTAPEGTSGRAMTAREMRDVNQRKDQIRKAVDDKFGGIKILDKHGKEVPVTLNSDTQETITPRSDAQSIVADCEAQKTKGNEAFVAGEYAQAILLYTLALDKAAELNDTIGADDATSKLFPGHIVLSNRSACFLKLGHHEKALADGVEAEKTQPSYVKGVFRKGLALHAMGRYQEAAVSLAAALKLEPKNKQIQQALQFADVRLQQEMRKRMSS